AKPGDRVGHEVDYELRERGIEAPVRKRQVLGGRLPDVDAWIALARRSDEGLGRIDGSDSGRPESRDELSRQCAGPAPDIEHLLASMDSGEVGELRRQLRRVHAHETVVGLRLNLEHRRTTLKPDQTRRV